MMSDFRGGLGGSSKIGQNRTRGVGSLRKIGHPIIFTIFLIIFFFQKRIFPTVHFLLLIIYLLMFTLQPNFN